VKNFLFALVACAALVGCSDKGKDFVGVWKLSDKLPETLTVTKVDDGYRVMSHIDKDDHGYMNVEIFVYPESNTLLVSKEKKRALELGSDGNLTSYLRMKPQTFAKAN
jgi:hypothetical protein